jgi:hypothetical protein
MKPSSVSREPLRIRPTLATVLATAAIAGSFPAHAAPIAVPNPGFDAIAKADGNDNFTQFAANQDVWRHWTRTENGGPVRIWNPGADGATTQGVLTYGFGGNAPTGNNVALVYSRYSDEPTTSVLVPPQWDGVNYFSATTQLLNGTAPTTAAPFDPTKIYRLAAKVGKPIVFQVATNNSPVDASADRRPELATWHGYAVQLAVGGPMSRVPRLPAASPAAPSSPRIPTASWCRWTASASPPSPTSPIRRTPAWPASSCSCGCARWTMQPRPQNDRLRRL